MKYLAKKFHNHFHIKASNNSTLKAFQYSGKEISFLFPQSLTLKEILNQGI
jgi:hypothetical protein